MTRKGRNESSQRRNNRTIADVALRQQQVRCDKHRNSTNIRFRKLPNTSKRPQRHQLEAGQTDSSFSKPQKCKNKNFLDFWEFVRNNPQQVKTTDCLIDWNLEKRVKLETEGEDHSNCARNKFSRTEVKWVCRYITNKNNISEKKQDQQNKSNSGRKERKQVGGIPTVRIQTLKPPPNKIGGKCCQNFEFTTSFQNYKS